MKKLMISLLALILVATALGSFTNSADNPRATFQNGYQWSGHQPKDKATLWAQEVEAKLEGETASFSKLSVTTASATATTLTAAQSGSVFLAAGSATHTVTLPSAAAGLYYTVIGVNTAPGADVRVDSGSGDSINGGTAGNYIANTQDVEGTTVTLVATNTTSWIIMSSSGTWSPQ